jgi:hypothetical protein
MDWQEFKEACGDIGVLAEERFRRDQLVMLGTLRGDGSARISPCEIDFVGRDLLLGMMWRSPKALDLLRDPRIVVHSVTCDRAGTDGDVKLYGRALEVTDRRSRQAFREAIQARIDWAPDEPNYHLFGLDVESAAYVVFGLGEDESEEEVVAWDAARGLRRRRKAG